MSAMAVDLSRFAAGRGQEAPTLLVGRDGHTRLLSLRKDVAECALQPSVPRVY